MAQYEQQEFATDSYIRAEDGTLIRGTTLDNKWDETFSYTKAGGIQNHIIVSDEINGVFPNRIYNNKRLISENYYWYITNKYGAKNSGSAAEGYSFGLCGSKTNINFSAIQLNQYNIVNDNLIYCRTWLDQFFFNDSNFRFSVNLSVQSHTGSNKPYVLRKYEDVTPTSSNHYPTSGFINEKINNIFSWSFNYDKAGVVNTLKQSEAKIEWRAYGCSTINTITISGETQQATILANTFPQGEIEWRITVKSDDNVWSAPSAWFKLTTTDVPSTTEALLPKDQYIDVSTSNTFSWKHITSTGSQQYAFDLQTSIESGWTNLLSHIVSSQQSYIVTPNTLPTGKIKWRVRTYNTDDIAGAWSNENDIYVIGAPRAATIANILSSAKPTVYWESDGQQLYQIQILQDSNVIYDTGNIAGVNVRSFKITEFIEDGQYTVKLRIRNEYDFWSDWASRDFAVSTIKPTAPQLYIVANMEHGIKLSVNASCLIYRREIGGEWQFLGSASGNYIDYTVASGVTYEYKARVVNSDDSFADSSIQSGKLTFKYTIISSGSDVIELKLKLNSNDIGRNYTFSAHKEIVNYIGRPYPVTEISGFKSKSISLSYFIPTDELDIILRLADADKVLYRAPTGITFWGTINTLDCVEMLQGKNKGYNISFAITAVSE